MAFKNVQLWGELMNNGRPPAARVPFLMFSVQRYSIPAPSPPAAARGPIVALFESGMKISQPPDGVVVVYSHARVYVCFARLKA